MMPGNGVIVIGCWLRIPVLSNGTDRFKIVFGLASETNVNNNYDGTGSADSILFAYQDNINSGKWEAVACNDGSQTLADTGLTAVANDWYHLEIVVNAAATSAEFFAGVNGAPLTSRATRTALPVDPDHMAPFFGIRKSAGTTEVDFQFDAIYVIQEITR
jgi:hypothetical protein